MEFDTVVKFVLLIGIIQGFVFNLFVFIRSKRFDKSIIYLNLCVLGISLNNLRTFIFFNEALPEAILHTYLLCPWYLLVSPMFYVFLVYYFKLNSRISSYLKMTLFLFVAESAIRIYLVLLTETSIESFGNYMVVEELLNAVYAIFIFYKTYQLVFFKSNLLTTISKYDQLLWLKNTLRFGLLLMILWIGAVVLYYFTREAMVYDPIKIMSSLLIYWLGYQGLMHSKIVCDRINIRERINKDQSLNFYSENIENKAATLNTKNEKHIEEFKRIDSYVRVNQRFLDPQFSLESLAEELSYSVGHVSKLINQYGDHNYSDYINALRVRHAKHLLSNQNYNQYKVVAIGLESGFNSKSTFYAAFKKFTSQTPSDYRGFLS